MLFGMKSLEQFGALQQCQVWVEHIWVSSAMMVLNDDNVRLRLTEVGDDDEYFLKRFHP
ncbi:hypothetical protein HanRHA438_Chr02g0063811 [Helianthus annuus]|nr:hypothetical protein HanRHA438_Chr02g0063811 [Helianthus annuus]